MIYDGCLHRADDPLVVVVAVRELELVALLDEHVLSSSDGTSSLSTISMPDGGSNGLRVECTAPSATASPVGPIQDKNIIKII